ncbi:hypothetical protein DICPUDRAFT_28303 [Dictyostelium purpureum]|uniref:Protein farnesyltransferase/geranylgeranyltransferase type-1 subunit alpha n=1 Tax=Dictyostelium purpureum TaxID=5786 RepID=F0ZBN6_DICPU|nr:uncharacterized protein DICPUDRAFT_75786 [Dictyostelium purpureum]XP_003284819.1 uncharacterized protein DICPUDRAFT_28303 [Dictyostelium purpureum]EGC38625.1 hypothetical protein DICPUDRAFT_75786 [Dictyostelium purpureum]EGC38626.1 hypothetical protein DICPUDRAFT_28303 [Dictyostelium purpureum]|eukprot:XP_003284818.1 hypothetical protein DICPUDRAFT_75786 [Dictyostelium purpureum]
MSSEEESDLYTPYSERPEWSDVTPIPQDDGPHPVCPIMYTDEFKDKMNYFRAILKSKEKSLRVLKLLEDIVQDNPSNYTVWYYRREVLKSIENDTSIEYDIADEMQLLNEMGETDPKNYQIWNHRRFIVEKYIGAASNEGEKLFLSDVLNEDAKNYHAWSHRQWLLKTFQQWQGELEFVNKLLKLDHRNNSAWNHRFFVLLSNNQLPFSKELIDREVEFALGYIKFSPNNESPWSYLRGLFKGQSLLNYQDLLKQLLELKSKYIGCSHVNSIILDFYQEENSKKSLEDSLNICKLLSETIDPIHKKYWEFKYNTIEIKLKSL